MMTFNKQGHVTYALAKITSLGVFDLFNLQDEIFKMVQFEMF